VYDLLNYSAYVQDTITHGRFTMQLGVRYDYNKDSAQAANIAANPLSTTWLPAIAFTGADPGVAFNNFSPRVGMTYDISANGKTLVHGNYARYYGQVGNGGVAGTINPVAQTTLRYPWVDANRDGIAQVGEVQASANPIAIVTGTWASANPGNAVSSNSVDPNLRNDSTDEVILGIDREIGAGFAVGANYVWRRYGDFSWNDRPGISSADFAPVTFTPAAAACPAGATCPAITFYQPLFQNPTTLFETNIPGYTRNYNGVEVTGRKRMSNHWLMNTSFAYNSTIVNFGSFPGSQPSIASATISEDPTNRSLRDGYQYDYLTGGSGIGNVYVNAKYLFKLSGMYQAPLGINVSAFYNARQGYPQEISVQTPSRVNGVAQVDVLLNPVGDTRLPNYQNVDFHVDRAVKVGTVRFVPSLDVFNVGNFNTIQAIRSRQNAANANQIQAILAPRVVRFGIKFNW
jgi:hypothetical protein